MFPRLLVAILRLSVSGDRLGILQLETQLQRLSFPTSIQEK